MGPSFHVKDSQNSTSVTRHDKANRAITAPCGGRTPTLAPTATRAVTAKIARTPQNPT
jgi:hypothetical protein